MTRSALWRSIPAWRRSSQTSKKVDGFNTYSLLLDLALGRRPALCRGAGRHAAAASCVLRRFDDAFVIQVPSNDNLRRIREAYPDIRVEVLAIAGERLSQQLQDGCSFRYGIVSIGGGSRKAVLASYDWCRRRLKFTFEQPTSPSKASAALLEQSLAHADHASISS